ncbi:MAG: SurA N-terminal domain-containing protein [Solirubrobacterales bacterium]
MVFLDMLDTLRNASKTWVVKLLFGLLILSFVAWGVGDVIRGGLFGHGPAIEVGKTSIPAAEVNVEFKREVDRLQPMFGGKLTAEDARKLGLMDRTIETIVTRTLIDEAARRLGLAAPEDAVLAQIANDPTFRNELGQFDRDRMRMILSRNGLSEMEYLRMERGNIMRNQIGGALMAGVTPPGALVTPLVRWREERRVADTILVRDDSVALPPAPEPAILEAYYKDKAARFMAPEYRALTVLLLRPVDVADEVEVTDDMIADAYKQRAEEFHTPERRQVSQVVLDNQAAADKAAEMVKAGKDLAAIGKDLGQPVVDLGAVEKGELPDDLGKAVFGLDKPGMIAPVKTPLGWHVARVVSIAPERTRSLAEVRSTIEKDLRREKAVDRLAEQANKIEDALGGGATLEETAKRFELQLVKVPAIDAQGKDPSAKPVAEIPKVDTFLDVAFHTEQGTESPLTDNGDNGYYLVRVDQVTPPQPKAFETVKGEVLAAWQAEKRHEQAGQRADNVAQQLKNGAAAASVAASFGLKAAATAPFTREGSETAKLPPAVVSDLFNAQPGGVAIGPAPAGWVVARLDKVIAFDPAAQPDATENARKRLSQTLATDLLDQYVAALNAEIGVKVDRSQLVREE